LVADSQSSALELIQALKSADWLEIEEIEWPPAGKCPHEVEVRS
jgi:hypothetical protein